MHNEYIPFLSEIKDVIKHTDIEYTFVMDYQGDVKPGQFFEVSIPKFGEAPISVSGIGEDTIDLTIRKVGKVTDEIFENYTGNSLFLRGPYGNGFEIDDYKNNEVVIVAGGTGVSPVRGVIDHFAQNPSDALSTTLIAGFKSPEDRLFKDDFDRWQETIDVVMTLDKAPEGSSYKTGLVTAYIPQLKLKDVSKAVAIVVGPPMMMKFSALALLDFGFKEENIWISHERRMCCGIGKCGHCKINDIYVCLDGPVFNYVQGKNLID